MNMILLILVHLLLLVHYLNDTIFDEIYLLNMMLCKNNFQQNNSKCKSKPTLTRAQGLNQQATKCTVERAQVRLAQALTTSLVGPNLLASPNSAVSQLVVSHMVWLQQVVCLEPQVTKPKQVLNLVLTVLAPVDFHLGKPHNSAALVRPRVLVTLMLTSIQTFQKSKLSLCLASHLKKRLRKKKLMSKRSNQQLGSVHL